MTGTRGPAVREGPGSYQGWIDGAYSRLLPGEWQCEIAGAMRREGGDEYGHMVSRSLIGQVEGVSG